jgi:hypothetical protein
MSPTEILIVLKSNSNQYQEMRKQTKPNISKTNYTFYTIRYSPLSIKTEFYFD